MGTALTVIGVYLAIGIIALGIFELITKRISSKFTHSTFDTMDSLANSGTIVSSKMAQVILAIAIIIFYPAVFIGMIGGKRGEKGKGTPQESDGKEHSAGESDRS